MFEQSQNMLSENSFLNGDRGSKVNPIQIFRYFDKKKKIIKIKCEKCSYHVSCDYKEEYIASQQPTQIKKIFDCDEFVIVVWRHKL